MLCFPAFKCSRSRRNLLQLVPIKRCQKERGREREKETAHSIACNTTLIHHTHVNVKINTNNNFTSRDVTLPTVYFFQIFQLLTPARELDTNVRSIADSFPVFIFILVPLPSFIQTKFLSSINSLITLPFKSV